MTTFSNLVHNDSILLVYLFTKRVGILFVFIYFKTNLLMFSKKKYKCILGQIKRREQLRTPNGTLNTIYDQFNPVE